jgi:hypothetical protein
METIKYEAEVNANRITDLDKFRSRYYELNRKNGTKVIYPSAEIYAYEHNLHILLAEAESVDFRTSWIMRPDYCSFDSYGTVVHWPLILFVNNAYSIEDFKNYDQILIPPYGLLVRIVRDKVPASEIEQVNKFNMIPGFKMFFRSPLDDIEKNRITARDSIDNSRNEMELSGNTVSVETTPTIQEDVQEFTLAATDITNMYVDLLYTPINVSSLSLYVDQFNIPQKYGYDYVIIGDDSDVVKRLSWNPIDCFSSNGTFVNTLEEGMKLKVQYLYES